jgi:hypothetical protein
MRIRSGVAGLTRCNTSVQPNSARAALSASRMAKKTHEPMKRGGSPGVSMLAAVRLTCVKEEKRTYQRLSIAEWSLGSPS